jgi:hypothetical protein
VTVVISSASPTDQGVPGLELMMCAGIKSGVFDAGASPSRIAAMGSG